MQGGCHGEANQVFTLRPKGSGEYVEIIARHSGKCLDVGWATETTASRSSSTTVTAAQRGLPGGVVADTPYTSYVAQHSGKCLDVTGGSLRLGPIQQWACNGVQQQRFSLAVPVNRPDPD